jgi:hypothetical protein
MDFTWGGKTTGQLSQGCIQCIQGRKSVLFITGQCNLSCYYCPVSDQRMHNSHMYINEVFIPETMPLSNSIELIKHEIDLCGSRGISITGGDPLLAPERIFTIGKALKEFYGPKFHIHLYTPGREGSKELFESISHIVDEIRFHPVTEKDINKMIMALDYTWDVGLELPATIDLSESNHFKNLVEVYISENRKRNRKRLFLNLNELEITETNFKRMNKYISDSNVMDPIVYGSREEAFKVLAIYGEKYPDFNIFFCPQREKDNIQIPKRYFNRASNILLPTDIIVDGEDMGLLMRGVIKLSNDHLLKSNLLDSVLDLEELKNNLIISFDIPSDKITIDYKKNQILTEPEFLEQFTDEIKELFPNVIFGILEESPTFDRIEFSFIQL